jgi:putative SOS response-associated peptidase YedK
MTLTRKDFRRLAEELDASVMPEFERLYRPRYNIAPTDDHWIVRTKREERQLLPAKWGLVNSWQTDAKGAFRQINARSETAATSRAFREAFETRRCAVPADGFFEWTGTKDDRRPIWYHAPDGELLLFAGLYESWMEPDTGHWQRTFTILTTEANELVSTVHDRMPVVLPREKLDDWLHVPAEGVESYAKGVRELLRPAAEDVLVATPVSRRVNSVKNDDEACLASADDVEEAAQGRLM